MRKREDPAAGLMSSDSSPRVAIVTGAGRGIGRACAIALAGAGFSVCLAARTREQLEQTRDATGLPPERSLIVLLDLAQAEAPAALFEAALDLHGRIDVLVNNAGWAPARTPLPKLREDDLDQILAINLRAPIALTRLAAIQMAERGAGTIVNIASNAGRLTTPGEAVYAAAKAGLLAFTKAAFADLRRPLRARDLCVALDLPIAPKNTENIRSKLKRLASRGILIETEPGLFARPRP